ERDVDARENRAERADGAGGPLVGHLAGTEADAIDVALRAAARASLGHGAHLQPEPIRPLADADERGLEPRPEAGDDVALTDRQEDVRLIALVAEPARDVLVADARAERLRIGG